MAADLSLLETALGHRFSDRELIGKALTHQSATADQPGARPGDTYQRLEFLGDRVLALVIADMLIAAFPAAEEGDLARRLTALVRNESCAAVASEVGLGAFIRLGPGELKSAGHRKATILGDVCEAVIGALYLDGGLETARGFVERHWRGRLESASAARRDPKTTLQEWAQGRGVPAPHYAIVARSGPDHAPRFTVEVRVGEGPSSSGEGASRREAEQKAARARLRAENVWKDDEDV